MAAGKYYNVGQDKPYAGEVVRKVEADATRSRQKQEQIDLRAGELDAKRQRQEDVQARHEDRLSRKRKPKTETEQVELIAESTHELLQQPAEERLSFYDNYLAPIFGGDEPPAMDDESLTGVLAESTRRYDELKATEQPEQAVNAPIEPEQPEDDGRGWYGIMMGEEGTDEGMQRVKPVLQPALDVAEGIGAAKPLTAFQVAGQASEANKAMSEIKSLAKVSTLNQIEQQAQDEVLFVPTMEGAGKPKGLKEPFSFEELQTEKGRARMLEALQYDPEKDKLALAKRKKLMENRALMATSNYLKLVKHMGEDRPETHAGQVAFDATNSLGMMAEPLLDGVTTALSTGNPIAGVAAGTASLYNNTYHMAFKDAKVHGASDADARKEGTYKALAETIPELVPMSFLFKRGGKLLYKIAGGAVTEGASEAATGVMEEMWDKGYFKDDATALDAIIAVYSDEEAMGRIGYGSEVGAWMGSVLGGAGGTMQAAKARYNQFVERRAMDSLRQEINKINGDVGQVDIDEPSPLDAQITPEEIQAEVAKDVATEKPVEQAVETKAAEATDANVITKDLPATAEATEVQADVPAVITEQPVSETPKVQEEVVVAKEVVKTEVEKVIEKQKVAREAKKTEPKTETKPYSEEINLPHPKDMKPTALFKAQRKIEKQFIDADKMTDKQFEALDDYARVLQVEIDKRGKTGIIKKPKKGVQEMSAVAPKEATSKTPPLMSQTRIPEPVDVVVGSKALGTNRVIKAAKRPVAKRLIREKIIGLVGDRLYARKLKGKTLGQFKTKTGEVISGKKDDVEVMAHEMAHYLDKYSGINFAKHYKTDEVASVSYTKDPDLVHIEGFAEFVRGYLTNDANIQKSAPVFYKKFHELIGKQRGIKKKLQKIQELSHQYYNQGGESKAQAAIGKDRSVAERVYDWGKEMNTDMFRNRYVDGFYAFKKIGAKVGKDLVSNFNDIPYASSVTKAFLEQGTYKVVDGKMEKTGKGLNDILNPVSKDAQKWSDFSVYAYARRANELSKQGRENLFDADMIEAGSNLGNKNPEFRKVFDELQGFWDRMMDYYVSMKLITPEQAKSVRMLNNEYVPMNRILEGTREGVGRVAGNPIKKLTGGSQVLKNMETNLYNNVQSGIKAAITNKAKVELYKGILSHEDGSLFAAEMPSAVKPVNLALEQQADLIKKALNQVDASVSKSEALEIAEGLDTTFFQYGQEPRLAENGLDTVVIDGKRHYFEINSPLLMDSLKGMYTDVNTFETLSKVKHMMSSVITNTPPFWLFNMFRDTMHAFVVSRHNFVPIMGTMRGMSDHILSATGIKKSKNYQDWILGGGAFVTADYTNANEKVSLDKRKALGIAKETSLGEAASWMKNFYTGIGQAFESGTRLEEFRLARKSGKSLQDATEAAREVSVNFKKKGTSPTMQSYARIVMFLNASIQGMDLTYRQFAEHKGDISIKNVAKFNQLKANIMKGGATMAGASIALWLLNKDDERYKKLTSDERARNWYIYTDDTEIRIPKPFEIGFVFGTLPELMAEYIYNDYKGTDYQKRMLIDGMAHTFLLVEASNVFGVAQPVVDLMRNKNFLDIPIVSPWELNVQGKANKNQFTSLTAIELAEMTGAKATQIDYLAKGYGGYVASMYNDVADRMLWNEKEWGEAPNYGNMLTNNWFMNRFVGKRPDSRTRYTQEFWLTFNNLKEVKDTYDKNKRDAKKGDRIALKDHNDFLSTVGESGVKQMKQDMRDMKVISKAMTADKSEALGIKFSPKYTGKQKAQLITSIYDRRNQRVKDTFAKIEKRVNMNIKTMKKVQK